jgi:hypothetical protein
MGRVVLDKDFNQFQEKILAIRPIYQEFSVRLRSLRGEEISFGWEGAMLLNGDALPLEGEFHYDSLFGTANFPASQLEIQYGDDLLRLDFSNPDEGGDLSQ